MPVELTTLTDGGQRAAEIARRVAGFLTGARESLDLALYDVRFETDAGALVLSALLAASQRDVRVRILYNVDHPGPIPVPPPAEMSPDAIAGLPVDSKGISGIPDLMHHKFVVRDGRDVLAGSANWTDDAWTRQENVMAAVTRAEGIGRAFAITFEMLWKGGKVEGTGAQPRPVELDGMLLRPWFCPAYGDALSHRIAKQIGRARRRIRIASPVLTAGPVLGTLVEVVNERRCDVAGLVDDGQLDQVFVQWNANGVSAWKIPLLRRILEGAPFAGKRSTPWRPGAVHDSMHAKLVVADNVSFVGSFNLSRSGESNAEAMLEIHDAALADHLVAFVDAARVRYPPATAPVEGSSETPARADILS